MVYIIQQKMIMKYLYKVPELVYIFCLQFSCIFDLLYITIDEC